LSKYLINFVQLSNYALGVTLPTIDAWRKEGILICRRMGGRVYFLEDEVYKNMPSNESYLKRLK